MTKKQYLLKLIDNVDYNKFFTEVRGMGIWNSQIEGLQKWYIHGNTPYDFADKCKNFVEFSQIEGDVNIAPLPINKTYTVESYSVPSQKQIQEIKIDNEKYENHNIQISQLKERMIDLVNDNQLEEFFTLYDKFFKSQFSFSRFKQEFANNYHKLDIDFTNRLKVAITMLSVSDLKKLIQLCKHLREKSNP